MQGNGQFGEAHFADKQQVDVAVGTLLSSGYRTKNDRALNAARDRLETSAQSVGNSKGLADQADEFGIHRRVWIGAIENEVSARLAENQSGAGQALQVLVDLATASPHAPDDFARVERVSRLSEEQRQHPAQRSAEQGIGNSIVGKV